MTIAIEQSDSRRYLRTFHRADVACLAHHGVHVCNVLAGIAGADWPRILIWQIIPTDGCRAKDRWPSCW